MRPKFPIFTVTRHISEHLKSEQALKNRIEFEWLIAGISTQFINLPAEKIDEGVYQALAEIGKFLSVDRSYIFLLSEDRKHLNNIHAWSVEGKEFQIRNFQRLPIKQFSWWFKKLKNFEVIIIPRVAELPPQSQSAKRILEALSIKSVAIVPMALRKKLFGLVWFGSVKKEIKWQRDFLILLKMVGEILINVLERKRSEEVIKRRKSQLELIRIIQSEIPMTGEMETILMSAAESIGRKFGYYKISVNLLDKDTNEIVYLIGWNKTGLPLPRGHRQKLGEGLIGTAALNRKIIVANDVSKEPAFIPFHLTQTKSELTIPLVVQDQLLGVLDLQDTKINAFTPEDVSVLQSIANYIAYVIEAKQKEQTLRETLEKYRAILENIQEGFYEVDLAGNFTFVNDSLCRMLGYPREKILGMNNREYMDAESAKRIYQIFHQVYLTGEPVKSVEIEVTSEDGAKHHAEFSVMLIRDPKNEPIGFRGIIRDITERKRAEQALVELNAKLYTLLQAIPDIICFKDKEGRNLVVNSAFEKLVGLSKEEIEGRKDDELLPSDLAQAGLESDEKVGKSGQTFRFEEHMTDMEGKKVYFETVKSPIFDENGNYIGLVGVSRDITERKRAEENLQASLKEKEILIREIHHRVKNNMQVISSLLSLQARNLKNAQLLEILKTCQNRIRSMALVHEKLYRSKNLSRIELSEYVNSLAIHLFHSYNKDTNSIKLNLDVKEIALDINLAIPCGLIINELISNALKYAFPEGRKGEIGIELKPKKDNRLLLLVRDNGIGFPQDLDIRNTNTLGMQIVTLLVDQIDGVLTLRRSPGTEFKILFPKSSCK